MTNERRVGMMGALVAIAIGCGDSDAAGGSAANGGATNCDGGATTQTTGGAGTGASGLGGAGTGASGGGGAGTGGGGAGFAVVPQNELVGGKTYAEWTAAWWQWVTAIPVDQNPMFDPTGANCALGQSGPVFFLAGAPGVNDQSISRACAVPTGKYIFFPVLNYLNDYPCPDPAFAPYPGQTLEEFLRAGAVGIMGAPSQITVEVDGAGFADGELFRFTSRMFDFTGDTSLTVFDPCITGTQQQGTSDGFWIMLEPLPPGQHTIHFAGTNTAFGPAFTLDVTYDITVQ